MKTLVLGLGNPILGDDSAGFHVAKALKDKLSQPEITVMETSLAWLNLLNLLADFDRVIIIDAIQTKTGKVGQVYRLEPGALNEACHATTAHEVNLNAALQLGNRLGLVLPRNIVIFAIEVGKVGSFSEDCTPEVERAIPVCVEMVVRELHGD